MKECVLTWGDLASCLKGRRCKPEREVSKGRSSRSKGEGPNEKERYTSMTMKHIARVMTRGTQGHRFVRYADDSNIYVRSQEEEQRPAALAMSLRAAGVESDALLAEPQASGNPVLVLQNLSLPWVPMWHSAVVICHDLARGEIILRSGTTERLALPDVHVRAYLSPQRLKQRSRWTVLRAAALQSNRLRKLIRSPDCAANSFKYIGV